MQDTTIIQCALLSVYDKTGIVPFAKHLYQSGVTLLSTGQTATLLQQHNIPVTQVHDYTGFPEMMGGRLKTLHPKIHGGILGRRDIDHEIMQEHAIPDIDLVVVNLYPFEKVTQHPEVTLATAIENIDIGGPTLIRGAAKNYAWCTVITDPNEYPLIIEELNAHQGAIHPSTRFRLAMQAFAHTAKYDAIIAQFLQKSHAKKNAEQVSDLPSSFCAYYPTKQSLRYGENPHQTAAFYKDECAPKDCIASALQLQGKALSYNNIQDANEALECVKTFQEPSCVIVKHANPCGVASSETLLESYQKAFACDPTSAFGGILAFNREIDKTLLTTILQNQFVEIIIAPHFTHDAREVAQTKPQCRLLQYTPLPSDGAAIGLDIRSVNGGILVQTADRVPALPHYQVVTVTQPTAVQMQDLYFSLKVVKFVKSNAIVFAKNQHTLGIGAGQTSRVFSVEIAAHKAQSAQYTLTGAVMASDAFFPFKDNIEKAHQYGIRAIIQPGGSVRDQEVIDCANQYGIAMVFTHMRHFRH